MGVVQLRILQALYLGLLASIYLPSLVLLVPAASVVIFYLGAKASAVRTHAMSVIKASAIYLFLLFLATFLSSRGAGMLPFYLANLWLFWRTLSSAWRLQKIS